MARQFARLATASGLSNLADGVFQITLPLVALGDHPRPAAFASVTLVGRLPWLLFSLPAGALADRLDRRRTMALVDVGRALVIGGLAVVVAAGLEELWLLYVVAFGLGVGETLFDTAAQSILPNVVDDPSRLSARQRPALRHRTDGQPVRRSTPRRPDRRGQPRRRSRSGVRSAYALAAGVLTLLAGHFRPVREAGPTRIRADIAEGVRYLAHHRLLRTLAVCVGISNLASTATFSVFPLFAVEPGPMGLSGVGLGLLDHDAGRRVRDRLARRGRIERRLGRRRALLLAVVSFPSSPWPRLSPRRWCGSPWRSSPAAC